MSTPADAAGTTCAGCGAQLGPSMLACPACRRLVHAARLQELAAAAREATERGDAGAALAAWREAHDLLPPQARQRAVVAERIAALSATVGAAPAARPRTPWGWIVFAIAAVAGKGKLLLAGLTKATTILSMLLAFGVYWTQWGWRFAAGFVLSIFVHEMGHVAALRRYGIAATAPMFLPGIGAVVRFRQGMAPAEEARVGLAGPVWGGVGAALTYAVALATSSPLGLAVAHTAAWVNLFNLLPIVPLDGGRGFQALDRAQRVAMLVVIIGAYWATGNGLLVLLVLGAIYRLVGPPGPGDERAAVEYAALVAGLAVLAHAAGPNAGSTPL
ncbi:MAG TPA: site-2 protease family protein [Candidatus Eisenbacteria bacterium]|nr:site-2 protease family protein [Candidatus Eisenbacteria bacterium]